MKKIIALLLAMAMLLSVCACGAQETETTTTQPAASATETTAATESQAEPFADVTREPRELHWASGGSTGQGYITGSVLAGILPNYYDGYSIIPEVTTGGVGNGKMLLDGLGDFISMQSDDATAFNTNERDWVGIEECTDRLRMVCVFSDTILNIIVRADSDIKSFTDLKGRKVAVLAGSTRNYALQYLLQAHDMTEDDFAELHDMARVDAATELQNGTVECIIDMIAFGNSTYTELAYSVGGIRMIDLTDEAMDRMIALNPTYLKGKFPADTYNGVEEVNCIKLYNLYLTYKEMPDYVVYDVLKAMYENDEELKAAHPKAGMCDDQQAFKDHIAIFELHPGAKAFYEEIGWL